LSSLIEIIKNTVEYKNIGLNVITISFLATILITSFQIRAAIKQNRKIKKNESSESWTITLFAYLCFYYLSFIFYGFSENSITLFLSGLPGFLYIPIMIRVWKYKKKSWPDVLASLFLSLIIPLMIISDDRGVLLIIMFGIGAVAMLAQTYQMIKSNDFKDVEPEFLISFFVSSLFWLIYASAIGDELVQFSSGLTLVFLFFFIILYYRWYKKRPAS